MIEFSKLRINLCIQFTQYVVDALYYTYRIKFSVYAMQ